MFYQLSRDLILISIRCGYIDCSDNDLLGNNIMHLFTLKFNLLKSVTLQPKRFPRFRKKKNTSKIIYTTYNN